MYSSNASINWMFVEGLLLHSRVTTNVFTQDAPFKTYYTIGWGKLSPSLRMHDSTLGSSTCGRRHFVSESYSTSWKSKSTDFIPGPRRQFPGNDAQPTRTESHSLCIVIHRRGSIIRGRSLAEAHSRNSSALSGCLIRRLQVQLSQLRFPLEVCQGTQLGPCDERSMQPVARQSNVSTGCGCDEQLKIRLLMSTWTSRVTPVIPG